MPTIFDNIENDLAGGLRKLLQNARRADFCVGYFNLRGWGQIAAEVAQLQGENDDYCRLLIGMAHQPQQIIRQAYAATPAMPVSQGRILPAKQRALKNLAHQLTLGCPTAEDERHLKQLQEQLRQGRVKIKYHGEYPLHAKLYLVHRQDQIAALAGIVGSSNLTLAGLEKNGELNVDVLDQDAAHKLSDWFEQRWQHEWSVDISIELADIIKHSWAGDPRPPYHIYLKTAYELSRAAIAGVAEYPLPTVFQNELLDFQAQAVSIATKIITQQRGIIIGDVVGLGKTMIACAIAKTFQEDRGNNVLIICPPKLKSMWQDYISDYLIAAEILSSGSTRKLTYKRSYKLIIVDESHNFRNRDSKRYAHLKSYLEQHGSSVILLTATPYNKAFIDIANQLRLFIPEDRDLNIHPEQYIKQLGSATSFQAKHSQTLISSLAAFEKSEYIEDWRELMRLFMIRRTRGHIIKNYAEYDPERQQHYLTFHNQKRFYFPARVPKRLDFSFGNPDDDYAKLYSEAVVEVIESLELPRYGLAHYIDKDLETEAEDKLTIANLTRAGQRLRGFARSGLFKRLESSGIAFLLSIKRHIIRNEIFIAALDALSGALPIGQIETAQTDAALTELDQLLFNDDMTQNDNANSGTIVYKMLRAEKKLKKKFHWVPNRYFTRELRAALVQDNNRLQQILAIVPEWQPHEDRKLIALDDLLQTTHAKEKVLVFTQFKDTARYLHEQLEARGITQIALAHGDTDTKNIIDRFSPRANGKSNLPLLELRVVITTDVLSEGQNLQDAHIIVNYDLPWALIRLVQRAGRIDRIGQQADQILCYSALPEEGVEHIINLRGRLRRRMQDNAELIGTDERFFEGDQEILDKTLRDLYDGTAELEEIDDETDLLSRAYDIWRQAEQEDPDLAKQITQLPDVIYSAKDSDTPGTIAYIRQRGNDLLAHIDTNGELISQSQSHILDLLACAPDTPHRPIAATHHTHVRQTAAHLAKTGPGLGGQLGPKNSARHKLYNRLESIQNSGDPTLKSQDLKAAIQAIHDTPLTATARDRARRLLQADVTNPILVQAILSLHASKNLCITPTDHTEQEQIICSMGLRADP